MASLPKKPADATDSCWEDVRPEAFVDDKKLAKIDAKVVKALKEWSKYASKDIDEIVSGALIDEAQAAVDSAKDALEDALKGVKKDKDAKKVVEAFIDVAEDFDKDLGKSVGDTGHTTEFLEVRKTWDDRLQKDIKKTTQGPKPYKLVFRNYAGKKDSFLFVVFKTGKVKQIDAKQLELAFRGVVGQTFEAVEGVVRKDGTRYIFEYPSGVDLPEKLRKQMKLELGMKVEFEAVSALSEVVVDEGDGDEAAASTGFDEQAWKAATEAWVAAVDTVDEQINTLASALRQTGDPELEEIADLGLSGVSAANIRVPLQVAIQEVGSSTGPDRAKQAATAREKVSEFIAHLDDERVTVCDDNEWAPTSIKATLAPALENLDRVLASVG